jgi:hypothetical protein
MTLKAWLLPTSVGPLAATWSFVMLTALLSAPDPRRIGGWPVLMVLGALFALAVAISLMGWDLVLLRMVKRPLPTGMRAWGSGVVAPLLAGGIYELVAPRVGEVSGFALGTLLGALAARIAFVP